MPVERTIMIVFPRIPETHEPQQEGYKTQHRSDVWSFKASGQPQLRAKYRSHDIRGLATVGSVQSRDAPVFPLAFSHEYKGISSCSSWFG
eukprot:5914397-Amphidinium_carterae.1